MLCTLKLPGPATRSTAARGRARHTIALAGNPNTGKSTLFNALTRLRQHTGNWPGKTVSRAEGTYVHRGDTYLTVDLPGTYSLLANSVEEEIARDFICLAQPEATVVVVDATSLERNLNLVFQITEITSRVVVCLNLMDEAREKRLTIRRGVLERELGVPVVPTVARTGEGMDVLKHTIHQMVCGALETHPRRIRYPEEVERVLSTAEAKLGPLLPSHVNPRWIAILLVKGDRSLTEQIARWSETGWGFSLGSRSAVPKEVSPCGAPVRADSE